jgi:integration host factor subunit alpha
MSGKTITRADLCEAIYRKFGLSRTECVRLLELVLKEVTDCLELGETVKLSSFGSFVVRRKGQRMGRNPKTNVPVPISPRRSLPSASISSPLSRQVPAMSSRTATGDGAPPFAGLYGDVGHERFQVLILRT